MKPAPELPSPKCTAAPLTPTPTPSCPWQMCTTDIFTLEGIDYLICGNFYSKMILIWCLPSGQGNTVKLVSLHKEMFSEHGIPKVLCSDNGPQYASAQFTEFCTSWGITHETSSLHYLQLNVIAEACIKSVKHALQHTKYSGTDPQLAPLALQATPIDAKLLSNLLYPCMPASPLQCTTPSVRSGSLPLWYMSCQKTATKCAPVMAWSTAWWDDTPANAVSSLLTLPQMSQQPHCRLLPDLAFLHHTCTHQACTTATASACHTHNTCDSQTTDTSCPQRCPCVCTYICNTQHSSCAAP